MELKDFLTLLGVLSGLATLMKAILEYQKAQKWKKVEFVAKEMKEFFSDYSVKRALTLLDWNARIIYVKDELGKGIESVYIDDDILMQSWRHHSELPDGKFTKVEALVRDIFDDFLSKLGTFNHYLKTDLVEKEDLKPYLIYWIDMIGKKGRKNEAVLSALWNFIDQYGYTDVQELCDKYGYNIKAKP